MAIRKKALDFEHSLDELEAIVVSLESGDLTLEQALGAFEKGIKLTRDCQHALQTAEQKVEILLKSKNNSPETPQSGAEDRVE